MQKPFAIAVQWPDASGSYLVHMQRPYFTAAVRGAFGGAWLLVNWAPGSKIDDIQRAALFRSAAEFCRAHLGQASLPIEFVERKHGHHLPRFLMAQTVANGLFIVEPEHAAPLVEVRDNSTAGSSTLRKLSQRFDVITQWRLAEMRKYYQLYLERQKALVSASKLVTAA